MFSDMKTKLRFCVAILLLSVSFSDAQRGGGGGGRGGNRGGNNSAQRDFQAVKGEFDAWKKVVLESEVLQELDKENAEGSSENLYRFLHVATAEERMSTEDFATLGQDYIKLVLIAQKQGAKSVATKYSELSEKAQAAAEGELQVETATLQVNRTQMNAQEMLWFGIISKKLSQGKRTTIDRKMSALNSAKKKAKSDQKIDEREREKLQENASEISEELMEALAS